MRTNKRDLPLSATELTDELAAAVADEFPEHQPGDPQVYPSRFFNSQIEILGPAVGSESQYRNAAYCATAYGGASVSNVINLEGGMHNKIELAPAVTLEAVYADSQNVPWLRFQQATDEGDDCTGPKVNAGQMLTYFNRGLSPEVALNNVKLEIQHAYNDAGMKPPVS